MGSLAAKGGAGGALVSCWTKMGQGNVGEPGNPRAGLSGRNTMQATDAIA